MKTTLINSVILAEDYQGMIDWYKMVFDLEVLIEISDDYNYTELGQEKRVVIGLTKASELKKKVNTKRDSYAIPQFYVGDMKLVMERATSTGGSVIYGPEEDDGFLYGTITDMEGNEIWIIEEKGSE